LSISLLAGEAVLVVRPTQLTLAVVVLVDI
jgi:hypothetical protein